MAFVLDFQSCDEVDADLIESAFAAPDESNESLPKDRVFRLLDRMARVSRPNSGIGNILYVLSCVARASWLGGRLDLLARENATGCEIDVRLDEGTRFDSLKVLVLYAPLEELVLYAEVNHEALMPLHVFSDPGGGELRLRTPMARAVSAKTDDPHARDTTKVRVQKLPRDAYNAEALRASSRPTTRLPAVRPAPGTGTGTEPDKTDDGWEE